MARVLAAGRSGCAGAPQAFDKRGNALARLHEASFVDNKA
jgi:hypothetical protein